MDPSPLIGAGAFLAVAYAQLRRNHAAAARSAQDERNAWARQLSRARARARRGEWEALIRDGWLPMASAGVPDPGNPGQRIALVDDRWGLRGGHGQGPGQRLLVAVNGTPGPDGSHAVHLLPVPSHFTDPVAAAAWTYDDPDHPVRTTRATYARLTRRT